MKSVFALCAFAIAATGALAQSGAFHPTKPVTLIVPYSSGGGTDAVARLFAKELGELWGQPVLVENRTGASGAIGSAVVAKALPDGQTLLLSVSSIAINPYLFAKLPYDTRTDFTPITPLAKPVVVMVGSPALKATDIRSFIALAKAEPGKHSFASSEPSTRLYGERLAILPGLMLKAAIQAGDDALAELKETFRPPQPSANVAQSFRRFGADEWDEIRTRFNAGAPMQR